MCSLHDHWSCFCWKQLLLIPFGPSFISLAFEEEEVETVVKIKEPSPVVHRKPAKLKRTYGGCMNSALAMTTPQCLPALERAVLIPGFLFAVAFMQDVNVWKANLSCLSAEHMKGSFFFLLIGRLWFFRRSLCLHVLHKRHVDHRPYPSQTMWKKQNHSSCILSSIALRLRTKASSFRLEVFQIAFWAFLHIWQESSLDAEGSHQWAQCGDQSWKQAVLSYKSYCRSHALSSGIVVVSKRLWPKLQLFWEVFVSANARTASRCKCPRWGSMVLLHPTDQSMFPIPGGMKPVATVAGILCCKDS